MLIKNFGLFWGAEEVEWNPGKGAKGSFRLLGRQGANRPGRRLADFRHQQGIYILYNNHGPYYVGLTKKQGLGKRLKDHLTDGHAEKWNRFSWFGFCTVLSEKDRDGLCKLKYMAKAALAKPEREISDLEALLIRAMGLSNINQNKFQEATEWIQVKAHEIDQLMGRGD